MRGVCLKGCNNLVWAVQTKQAVNRLVNVLDERRVFGAGGAKSLRELIEAPPAESPRAPAGMPESFQLDVYVSDKRLPPFNVISYYHLLHTV